LLEMDIDAHAKALRLRMYVLSSECARLIDLAECNRQQRAVEGPVLIRHAAEEHAEWPQSNQRLSNIYNDISAKLNKSPRDSI
jgi:hypothetical protein